MWILGLLIVHFLPALFTRNMVKLAEVTNLLVQFAPLPLGRDFNALIISADIFRGDANVNAIARMLEHEPCVRHVPVDRVQEVVQNLLTVTLPES